MKIHVKRIPKTKRHKPNSMTFDNSGYEIHSRSVELIFENAKMANS